MADRSLTIDLDQETLTALLSAAMKAGEPVEAFAERLLVRALEHDAWSISHARLDEYDRTGEAREAGPVLETFLASIREKAEARLSHQK